MDFLKAILCLFVLVGVALLLGKTQHAKHPATHCYAVIGSITVLLLLWGCL